MKKILCEFESSLFFKKTCQLLSLSFCQFCIFNGSADRNVLRLALGVLLLHCEALWKVAPVWYFDVLGNFLCSFVMSSQHSIRQVARLPSCPCPPHPESARFWPLVLAHCCFPQRHSCKRQLWKREILPHKGT